MDGEVGRITRHIERLKKGDKTRTAMHADVMNEIIDAVNAVLNLTVSPNDIGGKFIFSDSNGVLQLSGLQTIDFTVCIDGEEKVVTAYIKGAPRDPDP